MGHCWFWLWFYTLISWLKPERFCFCTNEDKGGSGWEAKKTDQSLFKQVVKFEENVAHLCLPEWHATLFFNFLLSFSQVVYIFSSSLPIHLPLTHTLNLLQCFLLSLHPSDAYLKVFCQLKRDSYEECCQTSSHNWGCGVVALVTWLRSSLDHTCVSSV